VTALAYFFGVMTDASGASLRVRLEFRGKRKWRNLLVKKDIAWKGEGGLRREEGSHD
jgi:hypothetical protein